MTIPRSAIKRLFGLLGGLLGTLATIFAIVQYFEEHTPFDLNGEWRIVNTVEIASYAPFRGMRIGYRIFIRQHGVEIEGNGEKWSIDERILPSSEHTPITISGLIDGNQLSVNFTENGQQRQSTGRFEWLLHEAGTSMQGTFTSTAAGSSGKSFGIRPR